MPSAAPVAAALDQVVGGVDELVLAGGSVVEVAAPTVVEVDRLVLGGRRTGGGAVEGTAFGAVVGGALVEAGIVVDVEVVDDVVVVGAPVLVAATEVVVGRAVFATAPVVVDSPACRLTSFSDLEPPGGPTSTSAPIHSPAKPMSAAQPVHASHVRCCLRDLAIASSSTNGRRT